MQYRYKLNPPFRLTAHTSKRLEEMSGLEGPELQMYINIFDVKEEPETDFYDSGLPSVTVSRYKIGIYELESGENGVIADNT